MGVKRKASEMSKSNYSSSESDYFSEDNPGSPITAPETPRTPRPSDLKTIHCPYDNCSKTFNRQARLTEHLRSHTNDRPFQCTYQGCKKNFLRDSHLKHHIKSAHTDLRDYPCTWPECDKSFATGTRLRRHEAAHEGRERWRCRGYDGCTETFRKHDTLKKHVMMVHENKKPFPCDGLTFGEHCTSAFDTAEKLRAHQRAKHDDRRFACTECLELVADSHDLGSFPAGSCITSENIQGRRTSQTFFANYTDLQHHIATVHPPTCSHCPSIFTTSKELKRHLELEHSDTDSNVPSSALARFPCTHIDCNRWFSKKGNLNVHIKTVHDRRRDFICGKTDISLPELEDKYREETRPQQIVGCGRDFTSKSSLEEHVRTAHLGKGSKRVEREKKRRKEAQLNDDVEPDARKKKSRKGQGKKHTALAGLTGLPPTGKMQISYNLSAPPSTMTMGEDDALSFEFTGYEPAYQHSYDQPASAPLPTTSPWLEMENPLYEDQALNEQGYDNFNSAMAAPSEDNFPLPAPASAIADETSPLAALDPLLLMS